MEGQRLAFPAMARFPRASARLGARGNGGSEMRSWICIALQLAALVLLAAPATAQTCNGTPYNPTFDICCNGVLSPKGSNNACCGTQPYSTSASICCGGLLSPKGSNNACCGTQPYDTN